MKIESYSIIIEGCEGDCRALESAINYCATKEGINCTDKFRVKDGYFPKQKIVSVCSLDVIQVITEIINNIAEGYNAAKGNV